MREIWTRFNSNPTIPDRPTMREQAQVTRAEPTVVGQSSSLPTLPTPAPESSLDTPSQAQGSKKRKVVEKNQLDRSSSAKQPRTAISDLAPMNHPPSRTPLQTQSRFAQPPPTRAGQFGRPEKRTQTGYHEDQESMAGAANRRNIDLTERKTSSRNSTHQPTVRASELVDPRIGRAATFHDPSTTRPSSGPVFGPPVRYSFLPAPVNASQESRYGRMDRSSVESDEMATAPKAEATTMTSYRDQRRRAHQPE
ncbi:MAG: hypothetical protein Q9183_007688, partial [Haloplaca sp. 2 TL-2023]